MHVSSPTVNHGAFRYETITIRHDYLLHSQYYLDHYMVFGIELRLGFGPKGKEDDREQSNG